MLRLTVTLTSLLLSSVALTGSLGLAAAPNPAPAPHVPDLADGVALAKQAAAWQAGHLGLELPASFPAPTHAHPSEAILALAARHGTALDAKQGAQVAALDRLPANQAEALTRVVDAFLATEDATAQAFAQPGTPDYAPILAARSLLLDASLALAQAWPSLPTAPQSAPPTLDLCPALALDTDGLDTDYWTNCALIVDVGGNDYYSNNAGGSGCGLVNPAAGALLDLAGNDQYASYGSCGVNGGAWEGSGFLLDKAGTDGYYAFDHGVNGGGEQGVGFLLDASGNDYYYGGSYGVNGGGATGLGTLIDLSGDDGHQAWDAGTNGGGYTGGAGLLADVGGYDWYYGGALGSNGGGELGVGLLLDGSGSGDYYSDATGWNWDWTNAPKGTLGAQVDTEACWMGIDLEHAGLCNYPLCPDGTLTPGGGHVATVCGIPVDAPCPQGVDPSHVAACGLVGPLCPGGVLTTGGGHVATVCGVPVDDPCPQGVDPDHAAACGIVLCPDGLRDDTDPGELAVVCSQTVPCPPQVHVNCPSPCSTGLVSEPGPADLAVVCGFAIPAPIGLAPACADGVDNDGDGYVDWAPTALRGTPVPHQPGKLYGDSLCTNPIDNDEGA